MIGIPVARKIYTRLAELRKDGPISEEKWLKTVADMVDEEFELYLGKAPQARIPGRKRDPLFDEMADLTGCNLDEMTRKKAREIAVAVKDILSAAPKLTPQELCDRAERFKKKWPTRELTPSSLAKWWCVIGATPLEVDFYREPPEGWREILVRIAGPEYHDRPWSEVRPAYGRRIWQSLA